MDFTSPFQIIRYISFIKDADFVKAFDSLEHSLIFATQKHFGFGPIFIKWIKTLLCNNDSCVPNNGSASREGIR
jgi:hypothetical protein